MTSYVQPAVAQVNVPKSDTASAAKTDSPATEKTRRAEFSNILEAEQNSEAESSTQIVDEPAAEADAAISDERVAATEGDEQDDVAEPVILTEDAQAEALTSAETSDQTSFLVTGVSDRVARQPGPQEREVPKAGVETRGSETWSSSEERILQASEVERLPVADEIARLPSDQPLKEQQVAVPLKSGREQPARDIRSLGSAFERVAMIPASEVDVARSSPETIKAADTVGVSLAPTQRTMQGELSAMAVTAPPVRETQTRSGRPGSIEPDPNRTAAVPLPGNTADGSNRMNSSINHASPQSAGSHVLTSPMHQSGAPDLRGDPTGSFSDLAEFETAGRIDLQSASRSVMAGPSASPDLPKHVAQQLSAALSMSGGKSTELALNPAELGRVRISLSSAETGIVVSIVAERPETLDLMRRNAMQLAAEFSDIGYESVQFDFGQSRSDQGASNDGRSQTSPTDPAGSVGDTEQVLQIAASSPPVVMTDRVDIRL